MDKQDQENSRDESNQDRDDDVIRRQEPLIKKDEKAVSEVPPEMVSPPPPEKSSGKDNYSSSTKLKPRMPRENRSEVSGPYSGRAWNGGTGNVCVVCDKHFPSQKALYGHMRCHPERKWRGVELPVGGPAMDSPSDEEWTEPVSEYTGLDQESGDDDKDYREYVDSGLDYVTGPVDLLSSLGRLPAAAKRRRSIRIEVVSSPVSGLDEEEQAVASGHQLLRLLKPDDLDQGPNSDTMARDGPELGSTVHTKENLMASHGPESDDGVSFKNQSLARNGPGSDGEVRFEELNIPDYFDKSSIVCGITAVNEPNTQKQELKKAPDSKKQKVRSSVPRIKIENTNGNLDRGRKIENNRKGKDKIPDYRAVTGPNTQKQDLKKAPADSKEQKVRSFVPRIKIENTNGNLDHGRVIGNNRKGEDKTPDNCAITGPNMQNQDLKKAPDRIKKQRVSTFVPKLKIENTNGNLGHGPMNEKNRKGKDKIAYKGQGKAKIDYTGKGKAILSESDQSDDAASDDELYFKLFDVLTNVERESSPEKFVCTTCNKAFPTHQALGGHRSSHNKFKIHIVNTIDEVKPAESDNAATVGRQANVEDDDNNPHVCNICNKRFATRRALGGHKKCHYSYAGTSTSNNNNNNGDEEKEKVVRAFDLNLMPDENEEDDDM